MQDAASRMSGSAVRWRASRRVLATVLCSALIPWFAGNAHAQDSNSAVGCPPVPQMPDQATLQSIIHNAQDRGLLWRLEKDGRTSWLYGTVHVGKVAWVVPGPTVMKALKSSDELALELNLLDPAVLNELMTAMRAAPTDESAERTGSSHSGAKPATKSATRAASAPKPLPQDLQDRLEKLKQQECVAPMLAGMRPDAQVVTLATLIARREGLDPNYGIDIVLGGAATGLKKPIISLEKVRTQIRVLVSGDPVKVEEAVRTGLDQLERSDAGQTLATLAQAWSDGRMNLLETYPQWCECVQTAAERRDFATLVDGRNPGLAAAIAREIESGKSLFAAVGALHMVGPRGLPSLLAARGFTVTRVEFPPPSTTARSN